MNEFHKRSQTQKRIDCSIEAKYKSKHNQFMVLEIKASGADEEEGKGI